MNTTSARIEYGVGGVYKRLSIYKAIDSILASVLKPKSLLDYDRRHAVQGHKKYDHSMPEVSGLQGISYGDYERDRLYYG